MRLRIDLQSLFKTGFSRKAGYLQKASETPKIASLSQPGKRFLYLIFKILINYEWYQCLRLRGALQIVLLEWLLTGLFTSKMHFQIMISFNTFFLFYKENVLRPYSTFPLEIFAVPTVAMLLYEMKISQHLFTRY